MLTTAYKRLTLRGLKWEAEAGATTLAAVLKAAAQAKLLATSAGLTLAGTAGNGHSVTFALPSSLSILTPEAVATMISDLLDRYDAAVLALGGSPTDAQIYAEMLAQLEPIREVRDDWSLLRAGEPVPA